jgi:hypothetical protein
MPLSTMLLGRIRPLRSKKIETVVVDKAKEAISASIANTVIANEAIAIDLTSVVLYSFTKYFAIFFEQ